jgi:hypothetical protein
LWNWYKCAAGAWRGTYLRLLRCSRVLGMQRHRQGTTRLQKSPLRYIPLLHSFTRMAPRHPTSPSQVESLCTFMAYDAQTGAHYALSAHVRLFRPGQAKPYALSAHVRLFRPGQAKPYALSAHVRLFRPGQAKPFALSAHVRLFRPGQAKPFALSAHVRLFRPGQAKPLL